MVVSCVTGGVTFCAGDLRAESGCKMVVSCVTGGVTFCAGDLCAESCTGGGFMCYRWCYLLCW